MALPRALEADFRAFCARNAQACPLLEVSREPVLSAAGSVAPGADLRTDLPRYRVFCDGEGEEERLDVRSDWSDDLSAFLLGCSFGFEAALVNAGIRLRHQEEGRIVPMYVTGRRCRPSGPFRGPLVVSMRTVPEARLDEVVRICEALPLCHGAPVHAGDPAALGIRDLDAPDFGDAGGLRPGEVPAFWACGVTSRIAARAARPRWLITHAPGHMLVTDALVADQRVPAREFRAASGL